jgi:hypothetical protein
MSFKTIVLSAALDLFSRLENLKYEDEIVQVFRRYGVNF